VTDRFFLIRSVLTGARTCRLQDAVLERGLPPIDLRCFFITDTHRERLYRDIDRRCEVMLVSGLLDEVTDLLLSGRLSQDMECSKSIGYRQTIDFLLQDYWSETYATSEDALLAYIKELCAATRNYAKRQLQWYRADEAFLWIHNKQLMRYKRRTRQTSQLYHLI